MPTSSEEVCDDVEPRTSTEDGDVSTSTEPNEPLCLNLATEDDVEIDVVLSESGVEEEPSTSQLSEDLKKKMLLFYINYQNVIQVLNFM